MNTTYTPTPSPEEKPRAVRISIYLLCNELESLSYLVRALLEQGYTPSEISDALKTYVDITKDSI